MIRGLSRELGRSHSFQTWFGLLLVLAACIGCGDGLREPDRTERVGDLKEPLAAQPTLLEPIGATTSTPEFRWSAAAGTLSYRLWVDDASGPHVVDQTLLASAVGCPTGTEPHCAFSPGYALAPGAGKFWVQGIDASGPGPWSTVANFLVVVTAPTLIAPTGAVSTGTPTYQWNSVPGATSYTLWVDDSTAKPKINQVVTAAAAGCASGGICSFTPSTAVAPGNVKWWVRAGTGAWSTAADFVISVPTLIAPTGATSTPTPMYRWNSVSGATSYTLWVNDSAASPKINQVVTAAAAGCASGGICSFTPPTAIALGNATWWVRAGTGGWSTSLVFNVATITVPTLIAPVGAISTGTPAYQWNSVPGATSYTLWVNDSAASPKINQIVTAAAAGCASGGICSHTPSTAIAVGNATWWVRAGTGTWSTSLVFNVSAACSTIVVTPPAPFQATGTFGVAYPATGSMTFTATGSTGSMPTWSASGLPPGLTLSATTGVLSGTPTQTGAFNAITVTFRDEFNCTGTSGPHAITIAPGAQNDTYTPNVGNTQVVAGGHSAPTTPFVASPTNPLTNDAGPSLTATAAVNAATTLGGSITLAADGKFIYTPPAGVIGIDTFTYTVTSNGVSATATISIVLGTPVWYVNNTYAGANGASDGRSHRPFTTMSGWNTAEKAGHPIFVHTGSGTTPGAVTLLANQVLWGQGAPFTFGSLTIAGAANPTLGGTVTLASGVTINSLTINSGANPAITGGTIGTATFNAVMVAGGTTGLSFTGGNGNVNWTGGGISGVSDRHVSITGRTGGTVAFGGSLGGGGTGVFLNGNTGATINFTGGMVLTTAADTAFMATGGGTVNVTGASNTLTTTAGTALNISNTTIGASGVTFRSISSNSAANGIVLNNTGPSGGLSVSGTGTAGTGGTIQNATGNGLSLTSTQSVALSFLTVMSSGGHGINASSVNGLTLTGCSIVNSGNGDNEHGLNMTNVSGTVTMNGTTFDGASEDLVHLETLSDVTINVGSNSQFSYPSSVGGFANSAFHFLPGGAASVTASIQNSTFTNVRGAAALIGANTTGASGTQSLTFANNTINITLSGRASGVVVNGQELTTTNISISNNNFSGAGGNGVISIDTNDVSVVKGIVSGNTISNPPGTGMFAATDEMGKMDVTIDGNTITNSGGDGIQIVNFGGVGTSAMDMTVTNNTINGHSLNTSVSFVGGVSFSSFEDSSCLALRGNNVLNTPAGATQCGGAPCVDYYLEEIGGTATMEEVPNTASTIANAAYVNSINDSGPVTIFGTIDLTNGATCNVTGLGP
jgi:hypothetical protein